MIAARFGDDIAKKDDIFFQTCTVPVYLQNWHETVTLQIFVYHYHHYLYFRPLGPLAHITKDR